MKAQKSEMKTIHRSFVMTPSVDEKLAAIAEIQHVSYSTILRDAVEHFTTEWLDFYANRKRDEQLSRVLPL